MSDELLRINELTLTSFRGFACLTLQLHRSFTLLLGKNGAGKTAVLEGLSVALGSFFLGFNGAPSRGIRAEDVRRIVFEHGGVPDLQPQWPVRVEAKGSVGDHRDVSWARVLTGPEGRTTRQDAIGIAKVAESWDQQIQQGAPVPLPLIAYYGTQRLWLTKKVTEAQRGVGSRRDGYINCLDPSFNQRRFEEWMYQQTLVSLQQGGPLLQLSAVERAVCTCIDGVRRFWFDVAHQELRLEWQDGSIQSFAHLSDGYRNMVAMVADIAWRATVLNPQLGEDVTSQVEGVVLIDEIELHLHPAWQHRVVADLRRTFPKLQFVATTHSPQVVAGAHREEVRLLADNALVERETYVEGRDSNSLLEDIFGVSSRPRGPVDEAIQELFRLIDQEEYAAALKALSELERSVGPHDPDVIRARWLIEHETALADSPDDVDAPV